MKVFINGAIRLNMQSQLEEFASDPESVSTREEIIDAEFLLTFVEGLPAFDSVASWGEIEVPEDLVPLFCQWLAYCADHTHFISMREGGVAVATVHVAGISLTMEGVRVIQRCALCGFKLIDTDLRKVAIPEGQEAKVPAFAPYDLVEVEGNRMSVIVAEPSREPGAKPGDRKMPPGFCLALVEGE